MSLDVASRMPCRVAISNASPIPCPRAVSSTPVGPKKPLAVASWQAKPSKSPFLTASQHVTGRLDSAVSAYANCGNAAVMLAGYGLACLTQGGVIAAPFAAWLTRRVPARPLMAFVGLMVSGISLYNLLR